MKKTAIELEEQTPRKEKEVMEVNNEPENEQNKMSDEVIQKLIQNADVCCF